MCGIVAAVADRDLVPVPIEGLLKLAYRGYDSAAIALLNPRLTRHRCIGRVAELATKVEGMVAHHGIAHTRWATHGAPSQRNTHPQISEEVTLMHNDIIENFAEGYPIALEGALKLKKVSDIHAEGYPAGELKHCPLALADRDMPVIAVAPNDALQEVKSNLQEVRARGGELYVFADADRTVAKSEGVHIPRLPTHYGLLSPVLHAVPLQILAYHVALVKDTDVVKPRNLAKSVTVK